MPSMYRLLGLTCLLAALVTWGCAPAPPPAADSHEGHDHDHEGHDHAHDEKGHEGHDHSHAELGPNGGHLLELGEEKYHAEWVHDDQAGKLTVFVLDGSAKQLVPIAAEKLTLEKKVGERADQFELVAVDRQGETPQTAKFEIVDKSLIEALKMVGDGVEANLTLDVNGESFTVPFAKHEHEHKH